MSAAASEIDYPSPLSPPHPPLSRDVELRRAMTAASRSGEYAAAGKVSVVYDDEWLTVVDKPSGIYCDAFLDALKTSAITSTLNLHLANRLDRDTSGLMVITKSSKASGKLVKAFTDHTVKKTYLALCIGPAPRWEKIKISSGHGRSKYGAWRVYSTADVGQKLPGGSAVRDMTTTIEVLRIDSVGKFRGANNAISTDKVDEITVRESRDQRLGDGSDDKENCEILVRAYPQSGRTHQIRLHCQYLGMPIKGDVKYCGVPEWKGVTCDSHNLHAESLSFEHPITGLPLSFSAPLPPWAYEHTGCLG